MWTQSLHCSRHRLRRACQLPFFGFSLLVCTSPVHSCGLTGVPRRLGMSAGVAYASIANSDHDMLTRTNGSHLQPDAKALQELWASAYEGWIGPPGIEVAKQVVYLTPAATQNFSSNSGNGFQGAWVEATLDLADHHGGVFGITAFNPMGQDKPHSENIANNAMLEKEIQELCKKTSGTWWPSFGFAKDWHEKGFTVAAPQDDLVALAKKYKQGAIYRFSRAPSTDQSTAPILRSTVPALLSETEADVLMVPCQRPQLERADPMWKPSE